MYAFGLSNHSPGQAIDRLLSKGIISDESDIAVLPAGTRLRENKKPIRDVIFVMSILDFRRNLPVFNSRKYSGAKVFLFASALRINELSEVVALDYDTNPAAAGLGFNARKDLNLSLYKRVLQSPGTQEVEHTKINYLNTLTDNVKRGSLLTPLMTFIYTLPSATHQTPVKEAVARFLHGNHSLPWLDERLNELRDIRVTPKMRDKLKEILTSEIGENYRQAFKDSKTEDLESVCKRLQTSDYEMRYIKSIVEKIDAPKKKSSSSKQRQHADQ